MTKRQNVLLCGSPYIELRLEIMIIDLSYDAGFLCKYLMRKSSVGLQGWLPIRPATWLPIRPDTWLPIRPHTLQFGCANDCL